MAHEENHKNNAIKIAHEIDKAIAQLPVHNNCKSLEASANRTGHKLIEKLRILDKDYDKRTNHGEKEGAALISYL